MNDTDLAKLVTRRQQCLSVDETLCLLAAYFDTLEPACMVHGYKVFWHIRSDFGWSQSRILILDSNPDIRSASLYGQF